MKASLTLVFGVICTLPFIQGCSTRKTALRPKQELLQTINVNLRDAAAQYTYLATQTPADRLPRSFENGKAVTSDSEWWCSGFYPGTLFYLYEATGNAFLREEALRKLKVLEKEQYNKTTHDLGFMMYCSYGNAHRLAPSDEYKSILVNSARSLASRFNAKTAAIRSWDSAPSSFKVIVDNMMNLELLFRATHFSGDSSFYKIAVTHANTTIKDHFRPDNSSYHLVDYDPQTGLPAKKQTVQGTADESPWARGQAWGLYGFTVTYRETKDPKYLDQADKIAQFLIHHPNLPKDGIPFWDFQAPGIPDALRDASAAAIMASALIELAGYVSPAKSAAYLTTAETILQTLSSPTYKAVGKTNGGFLLKHSVGNMPAKSEIDTPLSYADYYYVEAMLRYRSLKK